jgi:hypothetical protein
MPPLQTGENTAAASTPLVACLPARDLLLRAKELIVLPLWCAWLRLPGVLVLKIGGVREEKWAPASHPWTPPPRSKRNGSGIHPDSITSEQRLLGAKDLIVAARVCLGLGCRGF